MNNHIKSGLKLATATFVCLFGVFLLYNMTYNSALKSEKKYLQKILKQVLPDNSFDNDLLATKTEFGNKMKYQACLNNKPTYQIFEVANKKGYSGLIKLLVSINNDGDIYKVAPLLHRETPGLGDQIDINKSDWLTNFNLNINTAVEKDFSLKKYGGNIDGISGATITSRAVSELIKTEILLEKDNIIKSIKNCKGAK